MNNIKIICTSIAIVVTMINSTANAIERDEYICIAEQASGFKYKNGEWQPLTSKKDTKYKITRKHNMDHNGYIIKKFGSKVHKKCATKSEFALKCDTSFGELWFNTDELRYIKTYT